MAESSAIETGRPSSATASRILSALAVEPEASSGLDGWPGCLFTAAAVSCWDVTGTLSFPVVLTPS
jgi:hypothetical protein